MKFNLDFSLETSEERLELVKSIDLSTLTAKELELCSNYILYGKDPKKNFTSSVDRKEIQIKTKFQSYSKKIPVSLDALLESPTFNENLLNPKSHLYKNLKPTVDKTKMENVKGFKELLEEIQKVQDYIENNKDKLSSKQLYYLKHQLIDLRRHQYYLKDSAYPTLPPAQNKAEFFQAIPDSQLNYKVFPRGLIRKEQDPLFNSTLNPTLKLNEEEQFYFGLKNSEGIKEAVKELEAADKFYFNFLDKEHIYHLILNYWDLVEAIKEVPDSPLWNLIWTLDFYIEKAELSPQQLLIVRDKKLRVPNKEIKEHLDRELGIYHQENYISTIWNKITQLIADSALLNYDEWVNQGEELKWKKCNTCGKLLFRDSRNFIRKTKALDGLTNKCKKCEKKARAKS